MTHKELEEIILSKPGSWLDFPFGEEVAVYKVGSKETAKMFALIPEGKAPLKVSLKCDPVLAEQMRAEYETVMPGYHLNKKHWNTILLTGQITDEQIFDLVRLSYDLVVATLTKEEQAKLARDV